MRRNQPGFVIDGPVRIPKIYNGKDKTFFMFNMEWIRNASPLPYTASYPTAAERSGDFSSLVNSNGQPVLIYDPLTTTLVNGQYIRQPFAGNVIPANRINPIGKALIGDYPLPNIPGNARRVQQLRGEPELAAGSVSLHLLPRGPPDQRQEPHDHDGLLQCAQPAISRLRMGEAAASPGTCIFATTTGAASIGPTPFRPPPCSTSSTDSSSTRSRWASTATTTTSANWAFRSSLSRRRRA